MRDFDDTTLWRISAFERVQQETGTSGFARLDRRTVLPTTLLADLRRLGSDGGEAGDVLEIVAACLRHREPALLCLRHEGLVWPVTLFPAQEIYHSPRSMTLATPEGLATLAVLSTEPPGVRAPGHWMHERVGHVEHYRPLAPLVCAPSGERLSAESQDAAAAPATKAKNTIQGRLAPSMSGGRLPKAIPSIPISGSPRRNRQR